MPPALLGQDIALAAGAGSCAKHRQIHARAEVLAGGGDDNATRAGVVIDVADDRRQLIPERWDHGVEAVGALELHMGDLIGDGHGEAGPIRAGGVDGGGGVHGNLQSFAAIICA